MTSLPASQPGGDAVSFQAGSPQAVPAGLRDGEQLRQVEREIAARRPEHQVSPSLDRMAMLAGLLGDPQRAFPVIHVAGTNGKTSMTRMIDSLLRERGLRTGRFTSPHLVSMRERICLDGVPLSAERFTAYYERILPWLRTVDGSQPTALSFFEVLTGMMFTAFADARVDVAVIEVGLGGTWDATNIADGAVAVIRPVAMDHERYLGGTIEEIAAQKAGIIKPGAVAVVARQQPAAEEQLLASAASAGAAVAREGAEFGVISRAPAAGGQRLALRGLRGMYPEVFLPLHGAHQAQNAACALAAVEAFAVVPVPRGPAGGAVAAGPGTGSAALDPGVVGAGFAQVMSPGRLEVLRHSPAVVVDAAHNPAGMAATLSAVTEMFGSRRVIGVCAAMEDKDVTGVLAEMEPVLSHLIVTANSSPRSLPASALAGLARGVFGDGRVLARDRLGDAIEAALSLAETAGGDGVPAGPSAVLVTGSVVTAGEARQLLAPGMPA
jgi:folylpolyglutamate synthase/dihydropteroate synthase